MGDGCLWRAAQERAPVASQAVLAHWREVQLPAGKEKEIGAASTASRLDTKALAF